MIYLEKYDKVISKPDQALDLETKNHLYKNLDSGRVIFETPEDLEGFDKSFKKNYKVGFLYDMMSVIYPSKGKEERYRIISEKYHLWFTYRQFHNILVEYEKHRNKYLLKRSALKL